MTGSARQKGYYSVKKAVEWYNKRGYHVESVEKTGKFRKYKDLFSEWFDIEGHNAGFDLIAIAKSKKPILIQVTTTRPKTAKPFKIFAKQFGRWFIVQQYVRTKRGKENRVITY